MDDLELCLYAQNLAKPPFMRICREFENWRDLRTLSGKFLRQKSCYPESFRFLRLCIADDATFKGIYLPFEVFNISDQDILFREIKGIISP